MGKGVQGLWPNQNWNLKIRIRAVWTNPHSASNYNPIRIHYRAEWAPVVKRGEGTEVFDGYEDSHEELATKISAVLCGQATRQEKLTNQKLISVINEDQRP